MQKERAAGVTSSLELGQQLLLSELSAETLEVAAAEVQAFSKRLLFLRLFSALQLDLEKLVAVSDAVDLESPYL